MVGVEFGGVGPHGVAAEAAGVAGSVLGDECGAGLLVGSGAVDGCGWGVAVPRHAGPPLLPYAPWTIMLPGVVTLAAVGAVLSWARGRPLK